MRICQNCGSSNKEDALFCMECGKKLETDAASSVEDKKNDRFNSQDGIAQKPLCIGCGSPNKEDALFCKECGKRLESDAASCVKDKKNDKSLSQDDIEQKLKGVLEEKTGRKADIMFCLDCTGSMGGEIEAIKDTIIEFSDMIEKDGIRSRIGLIEFRDRLYEEEHKVHNFGGQVFTKDPTAFRNEVSGLKAEGGHDEPESSLDAIMLACRQPFDEKGSKVIVLVTDAPPHIPDKETDSIDEVIEKLKETGIEQFYCVIRTSDIRNDVYLKLIVRKGMAFDLGVGDDFRSRADNFKRTLKSLGKTISTGTRSQI